MALTLGTNCGFVTASPTVDPAGASLNCDYRCFAMRDTTPATAVKIVEIGWWCNTATEEVNYEVGIYSDNSADEPNLLQDGVSRTNAKGTTAGWKKVTGLDIAVSSSTAYWIAVQLDNTATTTYVDSSANGFSGRSIKVGATLPADWETGTNDTDGVYCIYAVWEAAGAAGVVKTVNGLAIASIKTINGLAVASVKTLDGVAYQ